MDASDHEFIPFDHLYNGAQHRGGYRVVAGTIIVVIGEMQRVAELDRMLPDRLAHILAHELLVEAGFAKKRQRGEQPDKDGPSV